MSPIFYDSTTGCISYPRHSRSGISGAGCVDCGGRAEHKYSCPVSPFNIIRLEDDSRRKREQRAAPRLYIHNNLQSDPTANTASENPASDDSTESSDAKK